MSDIESKYIIDGFVLLSYVNGVLTGINPWYEYTYERIPIYTQTKINIINNEFLMHYLVEIFGYNKLFAEFEIEMDYSQSSTVGCLCKLIIPLHDGYGGFIYTTYQIKSQKNRIIYYILI